MSSNNLSTKLSQFALTQVSSDIKSLVTNFIVIGSNNANDTTLKARLDDNELNNNLDYQEIANNRWICLEDRVTKSFYDNNNFLTIGITLPHEVQFPMFVYAFGLLNVDGNKRRIISITRSPSIFNKVKQSSSTFFIKITFSQENLLNKYKSDLFTTQYVSKEYKFNASVKSGALNILECDQDVSYVNVGTKISAEGLPENIVVIDNVITDTSLTNKKLRISKNASGEFSNRAIFIESLIQKNDEFVNRFEFDKAINEHTHNDRYYIFGSTVDNSLKLNGFTSSFFASQSDISELKDEISSKLNSSGGAINGSLLLYRTSTVEYAENEVLPKSEVLNIIADKVGNRIDEVSETIVSLNKSLIRTSKDIQVVKGDLLIAIDRTKNDLTSVIDTKSPLRTPTFEGHIKISGGQDYRTLEDDRVPLYSTVKNYVKTYGRMITLDMSQLDFNKAYAIILNERSAGRYTDTIIWNNKKADSPMMSRIHICGSGPLAGTFGQMLSVRHYKTNEFSPFCKLSSFPSSSAIVLYVRGGFTYNLHLRGCELEEPMFKENNYVLSGTTNTIRPYTIQENQNLRQGMWEFMNFTAGTREVTIDYRTAPNVTVNEIV